MLGSGCAKDNGRKPVYPVTGHVFLDGKPMPRAFLVFHPIGEGADAPRPTGHAEDDGSFTLSTYDSGDGAPAGEYTVTVEWRRLATKDDEGPPPNLLHARYGKPSTSGLHASIAEGENDLRPFQLKR
jgi:hypothetical protein